MLKFQASPIYDQANQATIECLSRPVRQRFWDTLVDEVHGRLLRLGYSSSAAMLDLFWGRDLDNTPLVLWDWHDRDAPTGRRPHYRQLRPRRQAWREIPWSDASHRWRYRYAAAWQAIAFPLCLRRPVSPQGVDWQGRTLQRRDGRIWRVFPLWAPSDRPLLRPNYRQLVTRRSSAC